MPKISTRNLFLIGTVATVCFVVALTAGILVATRSSDNGEKSVTSNTAGNQQQQSDPSPAPIALGAVPTLIPATPVPSLRATASPTAAPITITTTAVPTTQAPTALPTALNVTTVSPTLSPTVNNATAAPTTAAPSTAAPTPETLFVPPNPVPDNPDSTYFNYDINDSDYGPEKWDDVNTDRNNDLLEFGDDGFGPYEGHWERDPATNRCGREGAMSPVDLIQTDGPESQCDAPHEIRTRAGEYRLDHESIEESIYPNKLRMKLNRRSCLDFDFGDEEPVCRDNPPMADYPRYSSDGTHFSDLLFFDIKAPGEHRIEGEEFDAEIQMLHTHLTGGRVSSIGIPIRATADGYHVAFQNVLDQFQLAYDFDEATCAAQSFNRRRAASEFHSEMMDTAGRTGNDQQQQQESYSTQLDDPDLVRRLQERPPTFNPYKEFFPTIFFWRYDGSTTDPPCYNLTWFVMGKPLIISFEQLNQIKFLIFTHVNGDCEKTSVHNAEQSVARPLQTLDSDRDIMKCQEGDFESDAERDGRDNTQAPTTI